MLKLFLLLHPLAFVLLIASTQAESPLPGIETSQLEPALKGRALLEEMNCAACHDSPALSPGSRKSPRLSAVGERVNPDYLRKFIASPHETKPGTLMPDLLADVDPAESSDIAEALTHFLMSLKRGKEFELQTPDTVAAERGEELFHSVGCVACHSPRDADGKELMLETSVPLGALEKKYSFKSLSDFLKRPHSVRPSGRMPDLQLPGREVEQITHYLLKKTTVPGHLAFTTWRGKVWEGLTGDVQKEKGGHVDDFSLKHFGSKVAQHTAIQYSGYLKVETAGDYTFFLELNGCDLHLNGKEVISLPPSDRRGVKKIEGTAKLSAGWNQIEFTYFHTGRKADLSFEMEGPGFARAPIPAAMLATSDQPIPTLKPFKVDPQLAEQGKGLFQSLGCAQCHDDIEASPKDYMALASLDLKKDCSVGFDLKPEHKKLMALAVPEMETKKFSDAQMINKTLSTMNCIACHDRTGLGGISPERNPYFTGTAEALGDQGRLPPPLTHIGAKLTKDWLAQVMIHGGRQREYLNTRMPLFGEANVAPLIDRFEKVDSLEALELPKITNIRESKNAGYDMIGSEGFSCIACHDFNGQKSSAGALELVGLTDRLQKNWFHLYMRSPSRFHPTVIMPSYWPGGESIRKEVLGGDTDQQIEALWAYLSDGKRAKSPKGLSRQSNELRVADETLMCRGRGTAGYRGIGVGYPERVSLAFDSEEMALRQIWKGEFANVDHGKFNARGSDRIEFPQGIPFHRLASMDDSWPYKGKTDYTFPQDQGYQYRGYSLDKQKRPTFKYQYGEIAVLDFFEDRLDEQGVPYFRRTLTFKTPKAQEMFYFRMASGAKIGKTERGWRSDKLEIGLSSELKAQVRDGEPQELLLPITLPAGEWKLQLEYRW